ncbi:hypothetical protein KOM00_03605 [Geomonas sp. Red69]|uniref:hypothetical protein n=1 Tax=Geomonas diazotrophica TaxID=2843197 RepID=UPI001C115535|nr:MULTISPECIES: hypothetical protein [Geomonas]MBU5635810.1 hypothetical protein [Geomonas diazotrophica]QXE87091.1 hypothetical protein KP003_01385 [Geomonas nitrogeniifigens]
MKLVVKMFGFVLIMLAISVSIKPTIAYSVEKIEPKIYQLLEVTGSTKSSMAANINKIGSTFSSSLKKINPNIPDDIINKCGERYSQILSKLFLGEDGLHKQLVMVYKKYYSEKDIDRYLQFYQSKLWQNASKNKGKLSKIEADQVKTEFQKVVDATGGQSKQDAIKQDMKAKTDQFVESSLGNAQNDLNKYMRTLGYKLDGDKMVKL